MGIVMLVDKVDVCWCLLCLFGYCMFSFVGGGVVFVYGVKVKFFESCSSDMEIISV